MFWSLVAPNMGFLLGIKPWSLPGQPTTEAQQILPQAEPFLSLLGGY